MLSDSAANVAASPHLKRGEWLLLLSFSALYFVIESLRASSKFLWFDELCSLYICRLPYLADSWQAVLHGADYNPPLYYEIERANRALFGDGLVALRIPSLIGLWLFCLSLYFAVRRRAGASAALVAMLLPLCTVAQYYAVEARPHALVLGCCGLTLLCWQQIEDKQNRGKWWLVFAACLTAAFLIHCYAVLIAFPFVVAEIWKALQRRHIDGRAVLAFGLPTLIAVTAYWPLMQAYRGSLAGTGFAYLFRPEFWQLHFFYLFLFGPGVAVWAICLVLLALSQARWDSVPAHEIALYLAFVALPITAVILAAAIHGPFIFRYFLASAAGFAALTALGLSNADRALWPRIITILVLIVAIGRDWTGFLSHHVAGRGENREEPAIHIPVNDTPGQPLADHQLLFHTVDPSLPIVSAEPMDFLYFFEYAHSIMPRLYFAAWSTTEPNFRLYNNVRTWCRLDYNAPVLYGGFLKAHPRFYLYGDPVNLERLSELTKQGAEVESFASDQHHWLARVTFDRTAFNP